MGSNLCWVQFHLYRAIVDVKSFILENGLNFATCFYNIQKKLLIIHPFLMWFYSSKNASLAVWKSTLPSEGTA